MKGLSRSSRSGIDIISINMLLLMKPILLCGGPMIAGVVKQFWTDVIWGDVDLMFIDMPQTPVMCP